MGHVIQRLRAGRTLSWIAIMHYMDVSPDHGRETVAISWQKGGGPVPSAEYGKIRS